MTDKEGLILLNKPAGLTSHDCVAVIRKMLPRKTKVGHGGTLDPFSTGLLVILVGRATRLASLFQGMDKNYEGAMRLGVGTDSHDCDGEIVAEGPVPDLSEEQIQEASKSFLGIQDQTAPIFSAKRVGRKRAYQMARQGEAVELAPVKVHIKAFDIHLEANDTMRFAMHCSSGTYVRAVARDLGVKLGTPTHCTELKRTGVGFFTLKNASFLEDPFLSQGFIPFDQIDLGFGMLRCVGRDCFMVQNGQKITAPPSLWGEKRMVKVVDAKGHFLALGKMDGTAVQPHVVFPPPT